MNNIVDFKKPTIKKRSKDNSQPPFINLPPVTKYLLLAMLIIHTALSIIVGADEKGFIIFNFGYIPSIWTGQSVYPFDFYALLSPITYMFLHGNWMHLVMNGAMLMAFGAGIEQWMGGKKFILFFLMCGLIAIIVETIIHPFSQHPVIGASGAESGLFAAILILLQQQGRLPTGRYGIWPFAAFWIGISLVFGLVGGSLAGGQIAWASHLGGFIAGFGLLKLDYFNKKS